MPDAFFRDVAGFALPARRRLRRRRLLPAAGARRAARARAAPRRRGPHEGQTVLGWRDVPVDERHVGSHAALFAPCIRQLFVGASAELAADAAAFERKLYVIRRVAERRAGDELVVPSFSSRTLVYKGMLTAPQLRRLLPRPDRRAARERARARPSALLDQHVPELGARAPVSHDRPQRRDQHAARKRQLDARARVAACLGAVRRRHRRSCCRSFAKEAPTRPCSTTCWSCSSSQADRCRTR